MKTWMWIAIGVLVVGIIAYALYVNAQIRKAQIEADNKIIISDPNYKPRTSKLAEILDALNPFLVLFNTGGGNTGGGNTGGGNGGQNAQCDPDNPGYDINGFPSTDCGFGG